MERKPLDIGLQRRKDPKTGLPMDIISLQQRQDEHRNKQMQKMLQYNRKFKVSKKQTYLRKDGSEIHVIQLNDDHL